ncbi:MAG TPA: hypothetical protein PLJ34_10250 [Hyphomicrobiales bacterium]|nr:hypothetical protein [Hyphomicrobiales bacterium]
MLNRRMLQRSVFYRLAQARRLRVALFTLFTAQIYAHFLLAVVLGMSLPSGSAEAASTDMLRVPLCTVDGIRYVALANAEEGSPATPDAETRAAQNAAGCLLCVVATGKVVADVGGLPDGLFDRPVDRQPLVEPVVAILAAPYVRTPGVRAPPTL